MIQTAQYSDIGGRPVNEDTVQMRGAGEELCMVVADGLGGHGGGRIASSTAADVICSSWRPGVTDSESLTRLIREAHRAVCEKQNLSCAMKSTAVVLTISGRHVGWIHVGDSRLYFFREGKLDFQTQDHSASQIAVMLGEITPEQIRFHEDRSRILKALGQEGELKAEAQERCLDPGWYAFLLCSDGFWEYVLEEEMERELKKASDPQDWICRMRMYHSRRIPDDNDNNTAAAVWLTIL
ncbi:MAG: protein phosphatase 2C domain-containing protein [Lachnospiraceae bacterium]|nr:protein phosphatase 2C domain-containing protein [Lachnospiraceae bacterium]